MSTKNKPIVDQKKATLERKIGSSDDLNIDHEIRECQKYGYCLMRKFLGKGNYAKVYLASPSVDKLRSNYKLRLLQKKDEMIKVAIKIINLETVSKTYVTKFLPREVATMSINYEHPNVIKLLDFFVTSRRVYIIMEYADGGDLLDYLNNSYMRKDDGKTKRGITEQEAKVIFAHMMAGVRYIHSNDVAHRDLKFENILLCGKDKIPKLSDFGFAIRKDEKEDLQNTHCGSYAYAAPEVLKRESYESKASDIWSMGIMLFALVQGFLPFKESTAKGVLEAMKKTIYLRPTVSKEYKDLIKCLLRKTAKSRMTSDQIVNHPWLTDDCCGDDEKAEGDVGENKPKVKKEVVKPVSIRPHRPSKLDRAEFVSGCIKRVIRNYDIWTANKRPPKNNLPSLKDHERRVVEVEKRLDRERAAEQVSNGKIDKIITSKSQLAKKLLPLAHKHRPLDGYQESIPSVSPPSNTPMPPPSVPTPTISAAAPLLMDRRRVKANGTTAANQTSRTSTVAATSKPNGQSKSSTSARSSASSTATSLSKKTSRQKVVSIQKTRDGGELRPKKSSTSGPRVVIAQHPETGKPRRRPLSAATLLNSGAQRIDTVATPRYRGGDVAKETRKQTARGAEVPKKSNWQGNCCKEGCTTCTDRAWSNNRMVSPFHSPRLNSCEAAHRNTTKK